MSLSGRIVPHAGRPRAASATTSRRPGARLNSSSNRTSRRARRLASWGSDPQRSQAIERQRNWPTDGPARHAAAERTFAVDRRRLPRSRPTQGGRRYGGRNTPRSSVEGDARLGARERGGESTRRRPRSPRAVASLRALGGAEHSAPRNAKGPQALRTPASAFGSCRWPAPEAAGCARATGCTCRRSPSASARPRCRGRSASG